MRRCLTQSSNCHATTGCMLLVPQLLRAVRNSMLPSMQDIEAASCYAACMQHGTELFDCACSPEAYPAESVAPLEAGCSIERSGRPV